MIPTLQEIKAKAGATLATRDPEQIAAAVSVGRVAVVPHPIGIGDILAVLAPNGGVFLDNLTVLGQTDRNVYWSMQLLERGAFDIGMQATRAQVQALADRYPDMAAAMQALLALAERPDPVSEYDVRCLLWDEAGNWLGD